MSKDPEPPTRTVTMHISVTSTDAIPEALVRPFTSCCAEAQMLEHAIKKAVTDDVRVFASPTECTSFLEILERVTLGQAKDIMIGTSREKDVVACVGFYDFVKMQWGFTGRKESEIPVVLKDAVARRNRLAHQLMAEFLLSSISVEEAVRFLSESSALFLSLRTMVVAADTLSSKMGSIASDGSSRARFKTTS